MVYSQLINMSKIKYSNMQLFFFGGFRPILCVSIDKFI